MLGPGGFLLLKNSSHRLAATERRNPRSRRLDQLATRELLMMMNREDRLVPRAVGREIAPIARAVEIVAKALENGGRLIYVGAGTSGRLAALDAAECPPTFGVPSRLVQAIVAGGRRALTRAAEGVEDSESQGARDLAARKIGRQDVVIGVSASGSTPYVLGALRFARKRAAKTVLLTSNRNAPARRTAHITIAPHTGPEVITGSTRMKAGTAQKLILNMLSTAAMIRLGRVYNNWMVDLNMSNAKLRRRGLRILREATGAGAADAKRALAKSGSLRVALMMLKTGASASEARRRLQQTGGNLWQALAAHSGTSVQPSGAKRSIEAGLPKTSLQKTGLRKPGLGKPDLQKPDLRGKA
jgi:N-acetylmuramic acid 6-phosphate etherase